LVGCSATVTPPVSPARPTSVYLCDYGYHSSLLLPVGSDGTFVEYLFGDWNWAALNHTGILDVVRAGLFSSQATLGRRYVYEPGLTAPRPMTLPVRQQSIVVSDDSCQRLQAKLDARWRAQAGVVVYTGAMGGFYLYVKDDEPYGWVRNCNRETSDWLEQLGCRTSGWPLLSHFTLSATAKP
jgi:hypothetical protein